MVQSLQATATAQQSQQINLNLPSAVSPSDTRVGELEKQMEQLSKEKENALAQAQGASQNIDSLVKALERAEKTINTYKNLVGNLARVNEFNFLNAFYVYNTKSLLYWISQRPRATWSEIITQAPFYGIQSGNLSTTIQVLEQYGMIERDGVDGYRATPKARESLNHIRFVPPPPLGDIIAALAKVGAKS